METSISSRKQLAIEVISSGSKNREQVAESDRKNLINHLRDLGEYEDGMAVEEMACIILLYEIQREKVGMER